MIRKLAVIGLTAIFTTLVISSIHCDEEVIEYRKEVDYGDTIWDICASVATEKDNLQELVYRTAKENGLNNNADIHAGQEIVIHVTRQHYFFSL